MKEKDIRPGRSAARPCDGSTVHAAGLQGEGFLALPAFISLNKDGGWISLMHIDAKILNKTLAN